MTYIEESNTRRVENSGYAIMVTVAISYSSDPLPAFQCYVQCVLCIAIPEVGDEARQSV